MGNAEDFDRKYRNKIPGSMNSFFMPMANHYIESYRDNLYSKLLDAFSDIEGDIIELGVAMGDGTCSIGEVLRETNSIKKYIGFESFSGYSIVDLETATASEKPGLIENQEEERWHVDPDIVYSEIKVRELEPYCEIIVGDINETVSEFIKKKGPEYKISAVFVDCNAYSAAINALVALKENLSEGAIIFVDEHQPGGETRAVIEFMKKHSQLKDGDFKVKHIKHFDGHEGIAGPSFFCAWKSK